MTITLIGSNGFIGKNIQKYFKNCNFLNIDKHNTELLDESIKNSDLVINLASDVGVENIINNPIETFKNSLDIGLKVLEICQKYNKKLVYFSSSEVYGENSLCFENDTFQILNDMRGTYALQKLNIEFLIKMSKIEYLIIRPFNVVGPDNNHCVFTKFINLAKENKEIPIYVTNMRIPSRSFIDIRDFCAILEILINNNSFGVFNIGSPFEINLKKLAEIIIEKLNSKSEIIYKDFKTELKSKDIVERRPNLNKTKDLYRHKYNIYDIINSYM